MTFPFNAETDGETYADVTVSEGNNDLVNVDDSGDGRIRVRIHDPENPGRIVVDKTLEPPEEGWSWEDE